MIVEGQSLITPSKIRKAGILFNITDHTERAYYL